MQRRFWMGMGCAVAAAFFAVPSLTVQAADDDAPKGAQVTYAKDVAPIMFANCVGCHRPGENAPMSLRNYEEVRPWIKSIQKAVLIDKKMPPWHADPSHGKFVNDRSLSESEIATIQKWVVNGAPQGDPKDLPQIPKYPEGWRLGEPDLILTFDQVSLEPQEHDVFKDLAAKLDIAEDRWITAIEVKPGNRKILHHVIAYLRAAEGGGGPQGWLGAWAAGMDPMVFPEGTGRLVKKGSSVVLDMHYHPAENAQTDTTQIGLHFADKELGKEVINLWVANGDFEIPAGAPSHEVKSTYTFSQDSKILSLLPHMHYRGKDFTYTATYPDGRKETLLKVNNYDFNWQTVYYPETPIAAPKGTRIDCVAHFDNSTNNPNNPDPAKNVRFGNETFNEMMIGFVDFIVDEGVRPIAAKDIIKNKRVELAAAHPSEVYDVLARDVDQPGEKEEDNDQGEGDSMDTVLHLPAQGEGSWYIDINGMAVESKVQEFTRLGPGFTAKIVVPGQGTVMARGTMDKAKGTLKGRLYFGNNPVLEFEGTLAK